MLERLNAEYTLSPHASIHFTQLPTFKRILDDFVDRLGQLKLINVFLWNASYIYVSVSVCRSPSEKVNAVFNALVD